MSNQVIGIDFDDVVIDFNSALCRFHNEQYGTTLTRDDIFRYELEHVWDCTLEEAKERIHQFVHSDAHAHTEPVPGAIDALRRLAADYPLHIITSRPDIHVSPTRQWLASRLPDFVDCVHFTNHLDDTRRRPKSDVCRELGVTVFIEDALHHAQDVASVADEVFLIDAPWNQTQDALPGNIRRVAGWQDIVSQLSYTS